jgi:hypothetical protein
MLAGLRRKGSKTRQHHAAERKEAKSAGRAGTRPRKNQKLAVSSTTTPILIRPVPPLPASFMPALASQAGIILIMRSYFE